MRSRLGDASPIRVGESEADAGLSAWTTLCVDVRKADVEAALQQAHDHNDRRVMTRIEGPCETPRAWWDVEGLYLIGEDGASRVVIEEGHRLAEVPAVGGTLQHHFDRLANMNVISNDTTGAYAGSDEYTPYGRLFTPW